MSASLHGIIFRTNATTERLGNISASLSSEHCYGGAPQIVKLQEEKFYIPYIRIIAY